MANIMQQHKQTTRPKGVGKFCSPLEVMVMVDIFLFAFLKPTHKKQGWGARSYKGGNYSDGEHSAITQMHKQDQRWACLAHLHRCAPPRIPTTCT
jgi:hypothetical protein